MQYFYHAEICPICGGRGIVEEHDPNSTELKRICHGCQGVGWITVSAPTPLPTSVNITTEILPNNLVD